MLHQGLGSQEIYEFSRDSFQQLGCRIKTVKTPFFGEGTLLVEALEAGHQLVLSTRKEQVPWNRYQYLVLDVWNDNQYAVILELSFRPGDRSGMGEGITARIGINPRLKTHLVFPLSYLDGQQVFLPRFPHQLKGTLQGQRLDPAYIQELALHISPFDTGGYAPAVHLGRSWLANSLPVEFNDIGTYYVDEFGQWNGKKWPGKIRNVEELREDLGKVTSLVSKIRYPDGWSQYGGWTGKKFRATGFFRTENDGQRWWFVDPEGNAFLSMGMDCVDHEVSTVYTGNEDLFEWLPGPETKTKIALSSRGDKIMLDFLVANLIRTWGKDWEKKWSVLTKDLLTYYAFNTIGNWSDLNFSRSAQIPYVIPMQGFPTTRIKLYRDFPDVFDSTYSIEAKRFADQLRVFSGDPWLIGYFLGNEPQWAFGNNILAFEMFRTPQASFTKNKLIEWLKVRYPDVQEFNARWKTSVKKLDALAGMTFSSLPSPLAQKDLEEFSGLMVDEYAGIVCKAVKAVDSVHLNLGLRYAWISSELCYRAGKLFDVFSVNGYSNPGPPPTAEIARRSGKPVLIGEFHFGALDRGLPATGIQAANSQTARGQAYSYYLEQGFARPEVIGIHYFQWLDQSVAGRFDGENYNIGFLDICYKPYTELCTAAKNTHLRVYDVASGKILPAGEIIQKVPSIYY